MTEANEDADVQQDTAISLLNKKRLTPLVFYCATPFVLRAIQLPELDKNQVIEQHTALEMPISLQRVALILNIALGP